MAQAVVHSTNIHVSCSDTSLLFVYILHIPFVSVFLFTAQLMEECDVSICVGETWRKQL